MIIIDFIPLKGIPYVKFGMSREDVRKSIASDYGAGEPILRGKDTDCYFENSLQFSYEEDGTLSFIESSSPPPIGIRLFEINTWEISGEELLAKLLEQDTINDKVSEGGANPVFRDNIIALYDLDEQYDHVGDYQSKKWGAIGIGDDRYYKSICEIHGVEA